MTSADDIARVYDAFLDVLVRGPWNSHPERAATDLEARRRELRSLAVRVDRALWPPGVATLLWTPAAHEIPARDSTPSLVAVLHPAPDCPACE